MPVRVPVVISVSRNSTGISPDVAADLAAKLLLEKDGCDVNVIGSMEAIDPQSTDYLFLHGLPRHVLLLTGEPPEKLRQKLVELGLSSTDAPSQDLNGQSRGLRPLRRFEIWQISREDSTSAIVRRIVRYIKEQRTEVVQIGNLTQGNLRREPRPPTEVIHRRPPREERMNEQYLDGLVDRLSDLDL